MKIGLSRPPTPTYPIPDVDGAIVAKAAEDLGFESIFYGEHPITPLEEPGYDVHPEHVPYFQDPLVMLSRASAMTSKILLGGGVFLIPEHNPVMFAKQLASLDHYGGGRLIVGAGVGWSRLEVELTGGSFDRRWAQTRDFIRVMKTLWREEDATFEGEFFSLPPVRLFPKPAQVGGPPVLLGGKMTDLMARRVVSYADGWIAVMTSDQSIQEAPQIIADARSRLHAEAARVGRNPEELSITAILRGGQIDGEAGLRVLPSRDIIKRVEDAGAERALFSLSTCNTAQDAFDELARIAEGVL